MKKKYCIDFSLYEEVKPCGQLFECRRFGVNRYITCAVRESFDEVIDVLTNHLKKLVELDEAVPETMCFDSNGNLISKDNQ